MLDRQKRMLEVIDEKVEELIENYQRVLDLIQNLLKEQGMIGTQEDTVEEDMEFEISEDYFETILDGVLELIEEFEFDQIESILNSLKTYRMRKEHMEVVEKISEYMQELQVDEIKDLIQKWKENL